MAGPLGIEFPGAVYHVTARGDGRHLVFRDGDDRNRFLEILDRTIFIRKWILHAYCLMGNHYHLHTSLTPFPPLTIAYCAEQIYRRCMTS